MFLYRASLLDNVLATWDRSQVTGDRSCVVIREDLPKDVHVVRRSRFAEKIGFDYMYVQHSCCKITFGDQ